MVTIVLHLLVGPSRLANAVHRLECQLRYGWCGRTRSVDRPMTQLLNIVDAQGEKSSEIGMDDLLRRTTFTVYLRFYQDKQKPVLLVRVVGSGEGQHFCPL